LSSLQSSFRVVTFFDFSLYSQRQEHVVKRAALSEQPVRVSACVLKGTWGAATLAVKLVSQSAARAVSTPTIKAENELENELENEIENELDNLPANLPASVVLSSVVLSSVCAWQTIELANREFDELVIVQHERAAGLVRVWVSQAVENTR